MKDTVVIGGLLQSLSETADASLVINIDGQETLDETIDGSAELSLQTDGNCGLDNQIDGEGQTFLPIYPNSYTGELDITPKADEEQILECAHKTMPGNVTVRRVPYYETRNTDGTTVYIASDAEVIM